jgi:hypothetical protein
MDLSYFTTPNPDFGAPEWVFFIAQFAVAIVGAYLSFMHNDANPVRGPALRRLGVCHGDPGSVGGYSWRVAPQRDRTVHCALLDDDRHGSVGRAGHLRHLLRYCGLSRSSGGMGSVTARQRRALSGAGSASSTSNTARRERSGRKKSFPTVQPHGIRAGAAPPVVSTNGATSDAWLSRIGERRLSHQKESADPVCQGCIDPIRSAGIASQRYFHELLIARNAGAAGGALCADDIQHGDARARAPRITERNACHRRRAVADMRDPRQTHRRGARADDQRRCRRYSDANGNPPSLSHQILCRTHWR